MYRTFFNLRLERAEKYIWRATSVYKASHNTLRTSGDSTVIPPTMANSHMRVDGVRTIGGYSSTIFLINLPQQKLYRTDSVSRIEGNLCTPHLFSKRSDCWLRQKRKNYCDSFNSNFLIVQSSFRKRYSTLLRVSQYASCSTIYSRNTLLHV